MPNKPATTTSHTGTTAGTTQGTNPTIDIKRTNTTTLHTAKPGKQYPHLQPTTNPQDRPQKPPHQPNSSADPYVRFDVRLAAPAGLVESATMSRVALPGVGIDLAA
ncbi:hypothetical protein FRC0378_02520 [Corynebacterium diphtheriae]|nr:hypothetical protein FRC0213_02299 [Corynebacterium diphtheriae]CAB0875256.1 hypothetical protein FRC0378_02520 [Corynebacterium diphtheriae]